MTPLQLVLSELSDAKKNGKGWSARCPAHDDRMASLSITEGNDGRVLLHCHAGCTFDAICAAIGLEPADLFPPSSTALSTSTELRHTQANRENRRQTSPQPATKTFATAKDAAAELERQHGPRSALWTYHDADGEP